MAHYQQLMFIELLSKNINKTQVWDDINILEIGSIIINGTIRDFFKGSNYLGIDLFNGPGVDKVMSGDDTSFEEETFHISISCESFEHNEKWKETFLNMIRITKNGGLVVFTVATTGRVEHGTTRTDPNDSPGSQSIGWNYYKNLKKNDFDEFNLNNIFSEYVFIDNIYSKDLYFVGVKKGLNIFEFNRLDLLNSLCERNSLVKVLQDSPVLKFFSILNKIILFCFELLPEKLFQTVILKYNKFIKKVK